VYCVYHEQSGALVGEANCCVDISTSSSVSLDRHFQRFYILNIDFRSSSPIRFQDYTFSLIQPF
jgi:hypothetical protein